MTGADETLAHIDEVLGFADDTSIEWDSTMSADAMRSRPADALPAETADLVRGYALPHFVLDEAQECMLGEIYASDLVSDRTFTRLLAVMPRRPADRYSFDREGEQ